MDAEGKPITRYRTYLGHAVGEALDSYVKIYKRLPARILVQPGWVVEGDTKGVPVIETPYAGFACLMLEV
jgi:hypothetical protein